MSTRIPQPRTYQGKQVNVTAERLPAGQKSTTYTPGEQMSPEDAKTSQRQFNSTPNYRKTRDQQLSGPQTRYPGTVTETSKSLITGDSLVQTGVAGSVYTPQEIEGQKNLTDSHKRAISNLRGNAPATGGSPTPSFGDNVRKPIRRIPGM